MVSAQEAAAAIATIVFVVLIVKAKVIESFLLLIQMTSKMEVRRSGEETVFPFPYSPHQECGGVQIKYFWLNRCSALTLMFLSPALFLSLSQLS